VLSSVPWLVTISRHKDWVFAVSGVLIALNFGYMYFIGPKLVREGEACPRDEPGACEAATRTSHIVLWVSGAIYLVGFFSAYLLGPLLMRLG
jgi:hypothetical protein